MRRCCVPGCPSNRKKPYVSVFQFPKSPGFRNLWLKRIGRPLLKVSENVGVCIKHFEKNCIVDYKDWKSEGGRKRITVKPGAVPSIFDQEEVDSLSDDTDATSNKDLQELTTSMQSRSSKSFFSDVAKQSDNASSDSSPNKMQTSPTTDKPFIAIIKPKDSRTEQPASFEEINDDSSSCEEVSKLSPNKENSNSLSPYKHFPTVTVCLKEEDRVIAQKDLGKAVKRAVSVSSNNSSASTEVAKLQPKRRKIEKPAPTVLGKQNDCYCWVCHRENVVLACIACPRAYHVKCAGNNVVVSSDVNDWVCPECKRILTAENVDTRSTVLSEISLDKLCTLLRFSLNKMKHRAGVAFHQPVSLEHYPMYHHYVIHPMDFSLLEKNIKQKLYGCTEAFLADVKWILHNSCVFNGSQHPLSTNAKSLVKTCDNDMQEIEVCPDCFMHSIVRNKYWFSEVCRKPHPLVWAKLKGFPYWPAKVVRIADGFIDARFFGAHDRAWVPIPQCYHLSKEMPTSSKPKKKGNYEIALDELNVHVQLLIQKFGKFEYAPYRTSFDPNNKLLAYHGIDIEEIDKDEIPCDTSVVEGNEVAATSIDNKDNFNSKSANEQNINSEKGRPTQTTVEHLSDSDIKNVSSCNLSSEINVQKPIGDTNLVNKPFESISNSNQLNKIELVLQRIKGYISTVDDDNENIPNNSLPDSSHEGDTGEKIIEKELPNKTFKPANDDPKKKETEEISILSGLIGTKTLPSIEIPTISAEDVSEKDMSPVLDVVKKNDSFSLKLIETIESCKAKLGLSIESELDKIDSGDSESVDEDEDDDEEQEEEEEGCDNDKKEGGKVTSASEEASDESSYESAEEESHSQSSETDIETIDDGDKPLIQNNKIKPLEGHENVPDIQLGKNEKVLNFHKDKSEKLTEEANTLIIAKRISPEKQIACETHDVQSVNENSVGGIDYNFQKEQNEDFSVKDKILDIHLNALVNDSSSTCENTQKSKQENEILPLPEALTHMGLDEGHSTETGEKKNVKNSFECNKMEEDDDIFICPPVKPPTPPLICLDDETEPEVDEKFVIDSNFKNSPGIHLPKHSTLENSAKLCSVFGIPKLPTSARKSMKRVFKSPTSEDESSDEDFRVLPSSHGLPLSGAKRTFHTRDKNNSEGVPNSTVSQSALNETHITNERRSREQNPSENEPKDENNDITKLLNKGPVTSVEDVIQNSEGEPFDALDENDIEILNLKKKLSCLFSAFQLQHWKHNQEKAELRHNMNLIVMEMRASLEADKKQAMETLSRSFEREKLRCIEETKKKQWCAYCSQESRYACCWNTSYCTVACQKRHFNEHKTFCTQLKKLTSFEVPESKNKSPSLNDGKENKKVFLLNVVSQSDSSKSAASQNETVVQQASVPKIIASKAPVHLVSSNSSTTTPTVQLVLAPAKSEIPSGPLQPKLMSTKLDNSETQNMPEKIENSSTTILKSKTLEDVMHEKSEMKNEETNLEEIYFPSPPGISFEGLDTALPDDNIQFTHLKELSETYSSDTEQVINDKMEDSSAEEDLNWSDLDDTDNELVSIGRGVEVLAKYLNKCLIYGHSAKKLTRCLIDVIFPDIKLLASCSAFGNKSNVTKLTRAALPARKVEAIIDFVLKRFPEASRSEIVLAINMKCKEARNIVGKTGNNGNVKKTLFRRLLAKEQGMEANLVNESNQNTPKLPTTITLLKDPHVVCVPSSCPSESTSFKKAILPKPPTLAAPNIMRCSPQIFIRPKSGLSTVGPRLLLSPSTKLVRDPTKQLPSNVRTIASGQKYGGKILLPIEVKKSGSTNSSESPSQQNKQRPYIIIGSPASALPSGVSAEQQNSHPMAMARK